jgi:hypothetical protein
MTPYELQAGTAWVKKEYVKMSSIATRLLGNMSHPLLYLAMNLGMRKTTADDARRLSLVSSQIRASNGETVGGEDGVEKEVVAVE